MALVCHCVFFFPTSQFEFAKGKVLMWAKVTLAANLFTQWSAMRASQRPVNIIQRILNLPPKSYHPFR